MNALFLKDLADKTRRGQRSRVETGKSGGGNAFGYDVVKRFDASGEPVRGDLAGILAITLKSKRPATGAGRSQVELVAGTRFNQSHTVLQPLVIPIRSRGIA